MIGFKIEDVIDIIGGNLDNFENIENGYKVDFSNVNKCAVDLIEDHDYFDYSHIETFYDDKMYYKELIFQISSPQKGKVLMLEGVYQREMENDENPNATFEGIILQIPSDQVEEWKGLVYEDYAKRLTKETLQKFSDLSAIVKSVRSKKSKMDKEDYEFIFNQISELNREFSQIQKDQ